MIGTITLKGVPTLVLTTVAMLVIFSISAIAQVSTLHKSAFKERDWL
jgi:hypothetical protein